MYFSCSSYHEKTFRPRSLKATVNRVIKKLEKLRQEIKFDAIAFRGISGSSIAYPVSAIAGYHLIEVRRAPGLRNGKGNSHHGSTIEGSSRKIKRYIILDDFISSGKTVEEIAETITKEFSRGAKADQPQCVAIVIYAGSPFDRKKMIINKEIVPVKRI